MRKISMYLVVWSLLAIAFFMVGGYRGNESCYYLGMFCVVFAYLEHICDKLDNNDHDKMRLS